DGVVTTNQPDTPLFFNLAQTPLSTITPHAEKQLKAINAAADLAKHYGSTLTLVGVTSNTPNEIAHSPDEFAEKLAAYAEARSQEFGVDFKAHSTVSVDVAVDLEKKLNQAIHEIGADLIVMASHEPGFRDYIFRSHSENLATHTDLSVMIIR
ncbi:universal stress protein, partial [Granulosicoccus sp. 3-233]|uniref:universal stress protein n=1 Tax=Granulosicoccus sp. 3-233 TaxID=3417969 RepID=UPI003D34E0B9